MGNAAAIGVQLALLVTLSITPVIGNVAGAIVAYPITYLVSMRFVWKPAASGPIGKNQPHRRNQQPKRVGPLSPIITAMVIAVALYIVSQIARRTGR